MSRVQSGEKSAYSAISASCATITTLFACCSTTELPDIRTLTSSPFGRVIFTTPGVSDDTIAWWFSRMAKGDLLPGTNTWLVYPLRSVASGVTISTVMAKYSHLCINRNRSVRAFYSPAIAILPISVPRLGYFSCAARRTLYLRYHRAPTQCP